ncbi:collagen binding domain-containing protein [Lysinibacillus louembei]|uniref:Collagen binding domain-containing protein n=1 Tax=Lysinibacillus louembei TaxID=1470088 RepID=A0ABZ0RZ99_9BACI|nr:collagen binding domain-containing protein [Lysinibacillus louembei]WPK12571.1 collagen binding domain-containing protein [Lysinibacillus louembei]
MRKKINIAMLTILLVFQTFIGPLSVFAEETTIPELTPPVTEGTDDTGETAGETGDEATTTPDSANVIMPLNNPLGVYPDVDRDDADFDEVINLTFNGDLVSGTTAEGRVGDTVVFRVDLGLAPGHGYGPESKLIYDLPDQFANLTVQGAATIYDNGKHIGTVSISGQQAILTFNDILDDTGLTGGIVSGVFFEIRGTLQSVGNDWTQTIQVPGYNNITLDFQPRSGTGATITKTGTPDNSGRNSEYIDWTVRVNTNLAVNTNVGTTPFTDTLTGNHTFDSIVSIKELDISPNGTVTLTNRDAPTPLPAISGKSMTLNLPNQEHIGYEIVYRTKVDELGNIPPARFSNAASYNTSPVVDRTVEVQFDTPLRKSVVTQPRLESPGVITTEWQIEYNQNKRNIPTGVAKLTDVWTTGHELYGDVEVYKNGSSTAEPTANYNLTLAADGLGFDLAFPNGTEDAYVIKYKTQLKVGEVYPTSNRTITNTVTREDFTSHTGLQNSSTATYNKTSWVLNKTAEGVNYTDVKEMYWKIVANQAQYNLAVGTKFTDTYEGSYLNLQEGSLVITTAAGGTLERDTDYSLTLTHGAVDGENRETGFIIELLKPINGQQIEIEYTTTYEIKDVGQNDRVYNNRVVLSDTGIPNFGTSTDSASQAIRGEQSRNGNKTGYYNYETKTFHWDVELNFNYNSITDAIFKDVLPSSQEVTALKVEKGTLNPAGNFVASTDPNDTKVYSAAEIENVVSENGATIEIEIALGTITTPYKVTYETKDADAVYPHGSAITISNTAKLYAQGNEDQPRGEWNEDVPVEYTEQILDKTGTSTNATPEVTWNFKFNYAQSQLNNIVITDEVGKINGDPGQLILQNSFNVWEMDFTGTNSTPTRGSQVITNGQVSPTATGVALDVNIAAGTFVLNLPDGDKAYYVEYATVYMGPSGSNVDNEVRVDYTSADGSSGSDVVNNLSFEYNAGGTVGTVPFVILKTDAATGLPMENVKFELYGPYTGSTMLASGSTNEDGYLNYGLKLAQSRNNSTPYKVVEEKQDGYEDLGDYEFILDPDRIETSGKYQGFQVIEITNEPEGGLGCPQFELTVFDIDGRALSNETVSLVSTATGLSTNQALDSDGQVTFTSTEVKAGEYTIVYNGEELDTIVVQYNNTPCEAIAQPAPACDIFTIVVKDANGQVRTDITELTLKQGSIEVMKQEPNANGQFIFDSNGKDPVDGVKPDTYHVYEGKQYLGTVTLTYTENCGHEFEVALAPTCPTFVLTVNDVDGNAVADGTQVIIKDSNGSTVFTGPATNGQITLGGGSTTDGLEPDEYTVEVGGIEIGKFTTNINCEATVQPLVSGCSQFTLTVSNEDGLLPEGTIVTILKDGETVTTDYTVGDNGQVIFPVTDGIYSLEPGNYTVVSYTDAHGKVRTFDSIDGAFQVSYASDCADAVEKTRACTVFTITVKKPDGSNEDQGTKVIIEDANGNPITSDPLEVGEDGKVEFPANQEPGNYTVYEVNEDGSKGSQIGTEPVKVTYADNCTVVELPRNACPQFTLTVKTADGTSVQAGVKVSIVDENGNVVVANRETNNDGQIIYERDGGNGPLKQGETYTVINEAGKVIGTIDVSYTDEVCGAEVKVPENACPLFTLTIQDVNGNPRKEVAFVIKDNAGNTIATGTTDTEGKATVPYTVEPGNYVVVGTESPLAITVQDCAALAKPVPAPPGGGGGGGGGTPPTPEVPITPPTPEKPTVPEEPTTPPTPEEPTVPEEPTTPPTTQEKPTTPPAVEEVIKKIPEIPGIVPVPPTPGSEDPVRYEVPNIPQIVEELSKNPAKLQQTIQELEAFVKQYEALSPEEQAYVDELVNMDLVRSLLHELQQAANVLGAANNNQNKLPQTNDADQTAAIFAGIVLVALGFVLLRRRFTTTEK